jgi:hypothetical protein
LPHLAVAVHIVAPAVWKACGVLCAKHYLLLSLMFPKVRSISIMRLFKSLVVLEMSYKYEFAFSNSFVMLFSMALVMCSVRKNITSKKATKSFISSQNANDIPMMSCIVIN